MLHAENKLVAVHSENELIEGFSRRDPAAISALYENYFVRLCDFCYSFINDTYEAENIVSGLFEDLLVRQTSMANGFKSEKEVANYLYVAARNRSFDWLKRNKIKEKVYKEYTLNDELDFEYHSALCDKKLLETIYKLEERSIQVLRKIYFEDKSYEEIAAEMDISRPTVSNLRAYGIKMLSKVFKREDFLPHSCLIILATAIYFLLK